MHSTAGATQLLLEWGRGNEQARDEMLALVYDELRRLARGFLVRERAGHTLQPTALVHGLCRKVRVLGQNPKIGYQKFNDLQTAKISKKQLCDRAVNRTPASSSPKI
jgi:hypothetical protein